MFGSLSHNLLGAEGAEALAPGIAANGGLTSVSLLGNYFDMDTASMLLKVKEEKPNLCTLCGLTHDETELNYRNHHYGPADAMLLAPEIAVHGSLTTADVRYNDLDDNAKQQLRNAVMDRVGFDLTL